MKRPRVSVLLSLVLAAGAVLHAPAALSQSYGPNDQVLTVGVSQFRGIDGAVALVGGGNGYLYNTVPGAYSYYYAPLDLPEGALVEQICLYAYDSDPAEFAYVQAYLVAVKLAELGGSPSTLQIPAASAFSETSPGYGYWCTGDLSYTVRSTFDVDGDGSDDAAVHYVALYLPHGSELAFGGARIRWMRQVSPSPGTPTFGDVPAEDVAFPYVEALAASGITAGCAGGNFCPDANLTRRQMAVFLAKALGLHWSD